MIDYKDLNNYKKSLIILLISIIIINIIIFNKANFKSSFFILTVIYTTISGIASLYYYNKTKNIEQTVFLIIILFGLLCVFLSPINSVSDEGEHFMRSEITSHGDFFPKYITQNNKNGFMSIDSLAHMPMDKTFFETDSWNSQPINTTPHLVNSAFEQNPFYVYLAQAIGIDLAKLLNLNQISMLWAGRFFNLLLYASFTFIAIKKTPILKVPMAVVATFPLAIVQAASFNSDSFIFSFSFIVIAYLLYMYKAKEGSLTKKEIGIFTILVIILGLSKVTLGGFALLILIVPKSNFKNPKDKYLGFLSIFIILMALIIWAKFYAVGSISHSWRASLFAQKNVNPNNQIKYLLSDVGGLITFLKIGNQIPVQIDALSKLYTNYNNFPLFNIIYTLFFAIFSIFYQLEDKIKRNTRIITACTLLIIIFGTYLVQYLTWAPVGAKDLIESGVVPRYFLPAFVLIPLIINYKNSKIKNSEILIITCIVIFLCAMLTFMAEIIY